jgi:hypothetical protein
VHSFDIVDKGAGNDEAAAIVLELADVLGDCVLKALALGVAAEVAVAAVGCEVGFKKRLDTVSGHVLELSEARIVFKSG